MEKSGSSATTSAMEHIPPEPKNAKMTTSADLARQFRGSSAWKKARAVVMRDAKRTNAPCALCGLSIDWDCHRLSPLAPTVDHVTKLEHLDLGSAAGRRAAVERSSLRIAHRKCNSARETSFRARAARSFSPMANPVPSPAASRKRVLPDETGPEPAMSDCSATWNRARVDLHLWVAGHCPDPEHCRRSRRAAEAARAAAPSRTERLGNHSYWKGN